MGTNNDLKYLKNVHLALGLMIILVGVLLGSLKGPFSSTRFPDRIHLYDSKLQAAFGTGVTSNL